MAGSSSDGVLVCLRCSNMGWVWPIFIPTIPNNNQLPKKRDPKQPKWAQILHFFASFFGFVFLGFEPNNNVVGQDNPQFRANENIA